MDISLKEVKQITYKEHLFNTLRNTKELERRDPDFVSFFYQSSKSSNLCKKGSTLLYD